MRTCIRCRMAASRSSHRRGRLHFRGAVGGLASGAPVHAGAARRPGCPAASSLARSVRAAPEAAFDDLVTGHADIAPLNRLDAPEAANVLFGDLAADDPARLSLGWAILGWLEKRRQETPPGMIANRRRWIREVRDAFDIIALLQVRRRRSRCAAASPPGTHGWPTWWRRRRATRAPATGRCSRRRSPWCGPRRRALNPLGLAAHWLWMCENAGGSPAGALSWHRSAGIAPAAGNRDRQRTALADRAGLVG